ncbi:hypothetical protein OROMI_033553 [Orobanche minor]
MDSYCYDIWDLPCNICATSARFKVIASLWTRQIQA